MDLLFVTIAFIIMLSMCIYGESGNSVFDRVNLDFPYKPLFPIIVSAVVALGVAYAIVKTLSIFCNGLFDVNYIKYYLSDKSVEQSDASLINMIYNGAIPFIDDESIEELDYRVKYVKVSLKEYESLLRAINNKKCI